MGLDGVELLLAIEEEFQITLSDEEAYECTTPDRVTSLVFSKLRKSVQEPCPSMYGFYVLRKALMEYFSLPREKIKPELRLEDIFSRKDRLFIWKKFLKYLSSGKTLYAPLTRPIWVVRLMYMLLVITFIACLLELENVALALIFTFFVGVIYHAGTSFLAIEFPNNISTVGDLTRLIATSDTSIWKRDEVYKTVKKLVSEQLGVREELIKPDSHFIHDLGMD